VEERPFRAASVSLREGALAPVKLPFCETDCSSYFISYQLLRSVTACTPPGIHKAIDPHRSQQGREQDAVISRERMIQQLERKRTALNHKLMKTRNLRDANRIERELWALRAAISYHKSQPALPEPRSTASPPTL
jgi:hypothetical protein